MILAATDVAASNGGLAQLGERLNGIQKVVGSIPISSTSQPLAKQGVVSFLESVIADRKPPDFPCFPQEYPRFPITETYQV